MTTIRPFLSSGVRLGVVPDDRQSQEQSEELPENPDFSEELEGSCELMNEVVSDPGNNDEASKKFNEEQRTQRIRKRWEEYMETLNNKDDD